MVQREIIDCKDHHQQWNWEWVLIKSFTFSNKKIGQKFIFGCLEHKHLLLHYSVLVLVKEAITFILDLSRENIFMISQNICCLCSLNYLVCKVLHQECCLTQSWLLKMFPRFAFVIQLLHPGFVRAFWHLQSKMKSLYVLRIRVCKAEITLHSSSKSAKIPSLLSTSSMQGWLS